MGIALLLAAGAGLATTVGSLLGIMVRKPGPRFMSFTLGFSAGIMIYISFVELLAKAAEHADVGFLKANIAFILGMGCYFLLDLAIPHEYEGSGTTPILRAMMRLERTRILSGQDCWSHSAYPSIISRRGWPRLWGRWKTLISALP